MNKKPLKLSLLGTTGVGKDTCVQIIRNLFSHKSISVIRLADPLYAAQEAIYKICKTNKDFYTQDGELLNFLGAHMRKINPDVLKQSFLDRTQIDNSKADFVICPDARPLDIPFIRDAGFVILNIHADPSIAMQRRKLRGDLSLGKFDHATEAGLHSSMYDYQLVNNGSLEEFKKEIQHFISQFILNLS